MAPLDFSFLLNCTLPIYLFKTISFASSHNSYPFTLLSNEILIPESMRYVTFQAAVDGVPGITVSKVLSVPLKVCLSISSLPTSCFLLNMEGKKLAIDV